MNKRIIYLILLLSITAISSAKKVRVEVKDSTNKNVSPVLYMVNKIDTLKLNKNEQFVFEIDSLDFGNTILLEYKSITFNLGKLDVRVKTILLEFNQKANEKCYVINKVYGDAVQSNFDYSLNCVELHNIYLYNTEGRKSINKPEVKIRKKEN